MEKNKTAMQELIEWMIEESQVIPVDAEETYNKAKELLAKEQKQIMDAVDYGAERFGDISEQYYNDTYNKKDNG